MKPGNERMSNWLPSGCPPRFVLTKLTVFLLFATPPAPAQTNFVNATNHTADATNHDSGNAEAPMPGLRAEQVRAGCIQGRRVVCGKVIQILSEGLVVESGYTSLLNPPFNKSWRISGAASVTRAAHAVELNTPGTPCIGLVLLSNYPKRPAVKLYDYVSILAYPAGQYAYTPLPTVKKTIRRFAVSLATAVKLRMDTGETPPPGGRPETK